MMAKISTAALKRGLIAAEKKRLKDPVSLGPDPARYPKLLTAQRAGATLYDEFFRQAGLNTRKFGALRKQHGAELARIVEQEKAESIKRASRAKDTVHSSIKNQTQALQALVAGNGFFPFPSFSLDKPFLIWATPHSNILSDSNIEPFNSWAKIRVRKSGSDGREKVSFYFLWSNPSNFYAVISAATFMSATGHLNATSYGGLSGIDPTSRYSQLGCSANFALWSWWQQPPTATPYDNHPFASLWASSGFLDDSKNASISDAASLNKSLFLVPPGSAVVLEVMFQVGYSINHGRVDADFESGDFKIACPVVVVSVLSTPPLLTAG
jgi:hypothetical protein